MSAFKKYFKDQTQSRKFGLEHSNAPDFYLSVWQTTRSSVPLLVLRTLIFLTSIAIVLTSMIIYIQQEKFRFWFIYLTHWGLTVITLAAGFAVLVSARCYLYGPLSAVQSKLPWYVSSYWVLFNIAVPIAFLITVFYWTVLYKAGVEEELNHGLDVAVHGVNTLLMFLLLWTSSQPSHLLHFYQPVVFALCYFFFGLFYYLAGGVDPDGNPYVYAVVDWNYPGRTIGVGAITGLLLLVLYVVMVAIVLGRDTMARTCVRSASTSARQVEEGVPLRQTQTSV